MSILRPPFTATIIHARAGFMPPEDFLDRALKEFPTVGGYAVQEKGEKGQPTFLSSYVQGKDDPAPVLKDLQEIFEGAKDCPISLYLGKFPEKFDFDDIQPFLIGRDDEPSLMALFIEGDFPGYSKPDTGRSDETVLYEDIIFPILMKSVRLAGGEENLDIDKFLEEIRDPLFEKNLMNCVGHRAVFHVLPCRGEVLQFSKNELGGEWDWGYASNACGYSETPAAQEATQEPTEAPKKRSFGRRTQSAPAENNAPAASAEAPKAPPKATSVPAVKKTDETPAFEEIAPPSGYHGKVLKRWIRSTLGLSNKDELPAGWDQPGFKVKVRRRAAAAVKSFSELGTALAERPIASVEPIVFKPSPSNSDVAKAEAIAAGAASEVKTLTPVMDGTEVTATQGFITKHLGADSQKIGDPLKMQQEETKFPSFSENVGMKNITEAFFYPLDFIFKMAAQHPKAMALAFIEMRRYAIDRTNMGELTGTAPVKEKPAAAAASTAKAPAAAKPTATTGNKRSFGRRTAA